MTHHHLFCLRECVRARRHTTSCPTHDCPGCLPRTAEHGHLCGPCHRHLQLMLTDAPHIAAWLTVHLPRGNGSQVRTDAELRHGTTAPPAPIDLDVLELTHLWATSLWGWADELADEHHLRRPDPTINACAAFLLRWQTTIEASPWVDAFYDELVDITRDSHHHTPWAPELRRVHGIPCPECHTCALVVYGGQSDVTCQECRLTIPEHRYGIWTRMLAHEHHHNTTRANAR